MRKLTLCLLATALSVSLGATAQAQTAGANNLTKPVVTKGTPRNSDGHADLTGIWTNVSITGLTRPSEFGARKVLTKDEAAKLEGTAVQHFVDGNKPTDPNSGSDGGNKKCADAGGLDCGYNTGWKDSGTTVVRVNGEPRTSFVTFPENGQVPMKPGGGAGARRPGGPGGVRGGMNDNPEAHSSGERCLTSFGNSAGPVMQPLMYNNNYAFVQSKDSIAIEVEMVHDVRVIRLNQPHRTDGVRPWYGDSIGHYEGNTLVVETTNYNPQNRLEGRYSSADLTMTERFTKVAKDRLLYQFNVHSPSQWGEDWGGEYEFAASPGIYEYACHEGNYALADIMQGFRDADTKAPAVAGR